MVPRTKFVVAVAAPIGVFLLTLGWLTLRGASADREMEAAWRQQLGGLSFAERFPATEDNSTVLTLERLGASIGLSIAPSDLADRPRPTTEAAERYASIKGPLSGIFQGIQEDPDATRPVVPETVRTFLVAARSTLDKMADELVEGPPPVWCSNVAAGLKAPLPNYLGVLTTTRLLLADALVSFEDGDEARGHRLLEASWRVTATVLERPELVGQLIGLALVKLEVLVLRTRPELPPVWVARLTELDLQRRMTLAFALESYSYQVEARSPEPLENEKFLITRYFLRDWARRFHRMVAEARSIPVQDFDPNEFTARQSAKIPFWNVPARLLVPNFWDSWPRAGHVELAAELTVVADSERKRLAQSGALPTPTRRPARIEGLGWLLEPVPEGTRIRLNGHYRHSGPSAVPLELFVRRDRQVAPFGM